LEKIATVKIIKEVGRVQTKHIGINSAKNSDTTKECKILHHNYWLLKPENNQKKFYDCDRRPSQIGQRVLKFREGRTKEGGEWSGDMSVEI
jgi:hypothetical protein